VAARDQEAALARVYAEALARVAGDELAALDEELAGLVALFDAEPSFERVLVNPLFDTRNKRALLERALRGRATDRLVDALQVMRAKLRLALVRAVAVAVHELRLEREGRIEVRVASAVPLEPAQRAALAAAAARRTGKTPILVERVDPALLGGLVVTIGDDKIDSSITSELGRLERDLMGRAARELHSGKSYVSRSQEQTT
jgi:F-type H+-transporting ATPase subunit delta